MSASVGKPGFLAGSGGVAAKAPASVAISTSPATEDGRSHLKTARKAKAMGVSPLIREITCTGCGALQPGGSLAIQILLALVYSVGQRDGVRRRARRRRRTSARPADAGLVPKWRTDHGSA